MKNRMLKKARDFVEETKRVVFGRRRELGIDISDLLLSYAETIQLHYEKAYKFGIFDNPLECPNPKCFEVIDDMDGLGYLYCETCGYCQHASSHQKVGEDHFHCDYCGKVIDD